MATKKKPARSAPRQRPRCLRMEDYVLELLGKAQREDGQVLAAHALRLIADLAGPTPMHHAGVQRRMMVIFELKRLLDTVAQQFANHAVQCENCNAILHQLGYCVGHPAEKAEAKTDKAVN